MTSKQPVLLTVFLETERLRWFVGGISLEGGATPLLCSEPDNLNPYVGAAFDEQVNFLRHRLSGVLQRGCDRLWGRQEKACQIVFVADGPFVHADAELTPRVAEHFVEWMTNPPVVFFTSGGSSAADELKGLQKVAGELDPAYQEPLQAGLPKFLAATKHPERWELAPVKKN